MKSIQRFMQQPWLYLAIILIGLSLKFFHLDYKLFWYDEVCTVLHTSGKTLDEYTGNIPTDKILNINEYRNFLHLNNNSNKIITQFRDLLKMTNLNPLHYPLLMIWYRVVGDDPVYFRLFSVFIFILSLGVIYLISKLLFHSNLAGLIAASLFSVSPYIQLFAQEARYYMLWLFLILALHHIFLVCIGTKRTGPWAVYVISGILALYASPVSAIVIFGHFVYLMLLYRKQFLKFTISACLIVIGYLPWLINLITNNSEVTSALAWNIHNNKIPDLFPALAQFQAFVRIFSFYKSYMFYIDMFDTLNLDLIIEILIGIAIFIFIIYSLFQLIKNAEKKISLFVITSILPGFIFVYIVDLVRNSSTSMWYRYLIFNVVGIFLLLAYSLSKKIERGKVLFSAIYTGLVILGIVSIITISQYRFWYLGGQWQQKFIESAEIFSKGENTLVITDYTYWLGMEGILTVLNNCESNNIDILRASPEYNSIKELISENEYSDIYVFCASDRLVENLKMQYGMKMDSLEIKAISPVWKINAN